jgi:hypothetical protein
MSADTSSESGDATWSTDAVQRATDDPRAELAAARREASGKKADAMEAAEEYLEKVEEALEEHT